MYVQILHTRKKYLYWNHKNITSNNKFTTKTETWGRWIQKKHLILKNLSSNKNFFATMSKFDSKSPKKYGFIKNFL